MSAESIHLISASAGSGKTYRLAEELAAAITRQDNPVRPEAVIATTFTVKAAAELRERVRSRLLEAGCIDQAQRLGAARIGTVNSICAQLVTDFAFDLGSSPEVEVLDEVAAEMAFRHALSSVVSQAPDIDEGATSVATEAGTALMELTERWPNLDWLKDVRDIAAKARANRIDSTALRACARRSAAVLLPYFGPADADGEVLERALKQALEAFEAPTIDKTDATAEVRDLVRQAKARLASGRPLSWWDWARLAGSEPGAKSRTAFEPVREAARGHERHPALREDVRRCIELVFEVAALSLEAYERYKREWGLMDFVDQEVLALELLARPEVQGMLRDQVDLVLVDEFQDTSPLQLDIFLALARIAPRSVWVGDQKQSIFGFRGTDPTLMDAAIAAIVEQGGAAAHESLPYSWRSRAELVRLTSDVFAPAFAPNGIPPARVRLEPAPTIAEYADTMGAVVEGWILAAKNKKEDALALAEAVRQLLADPDTRVRDVTSDNERTVAARDIAILCRSHDKCATVTMALEAAGIRAVRPRLGLMRTHEARLALAALRLWVEPHQPLAAAEMGRLLVHPDAADEWLKAVIQAPGKAYIGEAAVRRVAEARERLPLTGPVSAFDEAIEAAGVREACLRWGNSAQRLANIDALRAFVHRYVESCQTEGVAGTVAGLVSHLVSLADDEVDEQATLSREDAVTVGTLHSAKGLEWPVTVLHDIDTTHKPTAFGVHLASDREQFDFGDPLGGRWIRYWPDPYAPRGGAALHLAVSNGPEHAEATRRAQRETLRLLYVGWTRARDLLVLTGRPKKMIGSTLGLLADGQGTRLISEPTTDCTWAGRHVAPRVRSVAPAAPTPRPLEPGRGYELPGPQDFPPARGDISQVPGSGALGDVEVLGPELFVQEPVEWTALGSSVHAFMAGDRPGLDATDRLAMAADILVRWSVQGALRADVVVDASNRLRAWVTRRWPAAAWHREWPVTLRQEDGTELAGYADLVLMDGEDFLLIDHKCLGGSRDDGLAACSGYAGQIGTYAEAIAKATGKRCAGRFVHLVAQGVVASLASNR